MKPKKKKGKIKEKKKKKTKQNPLFVSLFTFVVLLLVNVGDVVVTIHFFFSRKWLLSYVSLCMKI
jgi:hypothetical protein